MNKLPFISTLVLAAVLPLGQAAHAAPSTYPGSMCRALSGSAMAIDSNAHLENPSAATETVICPVVGDPLFESASADLFVTDQHFSEDVCCSARAKNTGVSVWFSSNDCSAGTNAASQTLSLTPPDEMGFTFTHRFYQCSVPAPYLGVRSELRTYRY
jgi:hypothetical protein